MTSGSRDARDTSHVIPRTQNVEDGSVHGREVAHPAPLSRTLMDMRDDDRALVAETLARGESVTHERVRAYPLHKACHSGALAVIEELIRLGADVDAVDKGNWTCAHLAARNHHNDALAVLLLIRTEGAGTSLRETRVVRTSRSLT